MATQSAEWFRNYRKTDPYKTWRKAYYAANRERIIKAKADWVEKNKARYKAYSVNYREVNREIMRVRTKRWSQTNLPKVAANAALRRRRKERTDFEGDLGILTFYEMAKNYRIKSCYYCHRVFSSTADVDHVIPLVRGGLHSSGNMCLACPSCNRRKFTKLPSEFITEGQLIFDC